MKEIKCVNGEIVKVDTCRYNYINAHSWRVYYQEGRKPRITTRISAGKDVNIITMIKPSNRWEFANGDHFDYRKCNIITKKDDRVHLRVSKSDHIKWKKQAKERGCHLSELIHERMNNVRGKK